MIIRGKNTIQQLYLKVVMVMIAMVAASPVKAIEEQFNEAQQQISVSFRTTGQSQIGGVSGINDLLQRQHSGGMFDEFTGQASFNVSLGGIANQNGIGYSLNLAYYGGGLTTLQNANPKYSPGSWVGAGFNLKGPHITVSGEDLLFEHQKYSLSLDGISEQGMVPTTTMDEFVLKNNPFIRIKRVVGTRTNQLKDNCPNQANQTTSTTTPYILYWSVDLPNGTNYQFGDSALDCDQTEYELCRPNVGNNYKYNPFYTLVTGSKSEVVFYLARIVDKGNKSAIWFKYNKVKENVVGSCNSVNSTPTFSSSMDRAIYLKEIYSTNGTAKTDLKTSQIILNTANKTEETVYNSTQTDPAAYYENQKLDNIQYIENGSLMKTLNFQYQTSAARMVLSRIYQTAPGFTRQKQILLLGYTTGTLNLATLEDESGRIIEYAYSKVLSGALNGPDSSYQVLDFGFPLAVGVKIVIAKQIGDKFYVQLENWSSGCTTSPVNPDFFTEKLFEFENRGTHWKLNRTIPAPWVGCPTAIKSYLSPDGKYFIWVLGTTTTTELQIYDLTSKSNPVPSQSFTNTEGTGTTRHHVEIYAYPNWFVLYNWDKKTNLSFYTKTAAGTWTDACPSEIAPSTYTANTANPRTNNYSGEVEVDQTKACLTFNAPLEISPGPNYLVVGHSTLDILHVYGYDGRIKDFVKGLETTTPVLPNFTATEAGDPALRGARPFYRQGIYHNNWTQNISQVRASENLVAVISSTGLDFWKYLYVYGWDGKQLRYLYDEAILANQNNGDAVDELDISLGPDYFIVKNHCRDYLTDTNFPRGFIYYKVDLKAWKVAPKVLLSTTGTAFDRDAEDWVVKTYPDFFFMEKMVNLKRSLALSPAIVQNKFCSNAGSSYLGGIYYPTLGESYAFALDNNRNPVSVTSEFNRTSFKVNAVNFSASGDRILGIDVGTTPLNATSNPKLFQTTNINIWKRNNNMGAGTQFTLDSNLVPKLNTLLAEPNAYYDARLVTGGVMLATYVKSSTYEYITTMRFYPDRFEAVPNASNVQVQGGYAVSSITIKNNGSSSTGNSLDKILVTYPTMPPEGAATTLLKNYQSGLPNFKLVKKEYGEGAQITSYVRDELGAQVSDQNKGLIGSMTKSWVLPDKANLKKVGGKMDSVLVVSNTIPGKPVESFTVQKIQDSSRTYYNNGHRSSAVYYANYDSKNGQPKITVKKVAGKYLVTLDIYHHDLVPGYTGIHFDMLRQNSVFQFSTDPCNRASATNPCGNLDRTWFDNTKLSSIVSSKIITYDASERAFETYEWRPSSLTAGYYPPMDGNPLNTNANWKWVKVGSVTQRQEAPNNPVARCKSDLPIEMEQMGQYTSNFYGDVECDPIGSVANSALFSAALLTGEENINTAGCPSGIPCMGALGRWQAGGSALIQSQVVHTGKSAIKVTAQFGPTINLQIRKSAGFMDRNKGFMVSAWMLADPNSNPSFTVEFRKNSNPPTPGSGTSPDPVVYNIDVVQEYIAAKGPFPTKKWVKVERLIPYEELSSKGVFGATPNYDYLRIWIGKGTAANTNPVYVDDVRLYPADASFSTRNFDNTGLVTSVLDGQNEPTFMEYDIWRNPVGARNKDGLVNSSSAVKLFNE